MREKRLTPRSERGSLQNMVMNVQQEIVSRTRAAIASRVSRDKSESVLNTPSPLPSSQDSAGSILAARIDALFKVVRAAYLATPANAGILMVILWGPITVDVLLGWFGAVVAVTLVRLGMHRRYVTRGANDASAAVWERRFALGALAAGALWTFPMMVLFPAGAPLLQMAVIFIVGGMIVGSTGIYAASRLSFYSFGTLPFITVVLQLVMQEEATYKLLALTVVFFGVAMVKVHGDIHRSLMETLRARFSLASLLEQLRASDARLRDAIEHFPGGFALWDERGRLSLCNQSFANLYGAGKLADEVAGMTYLQAAENACLVEQPPAGHVQDRDGWIASSVARQQQADGRLHQFQLRDGRWMQSKWARTRRGAVVGMVDDITELKRARDSYFDLVRRKTSSWTRCRSGWCSSNAACSCVATSGSNPCWAMQPASWPASLRARFFFRIPPGQACSAMR